MPAGEIVGIVTGVVGCVMAIATPFVRLALDQCSKYVKPDEDNSKYLQEERQNIQNIIHILRRWVSILDNDDRLIKEALETIEMIDDFPNIDPWNCFGFCWCLADFRRSYLVGKYVSEVKQRADKLRDELRRQEIDINLLGQFGGNYARLVGEQPHKVVEKIGSKILRNFGIIGVYGACGVGKTHVVRHACRRLQNLRDSITLIWLEVSNGDDLLTLQTEIAKQIDLKLPINGSVQDNAKELNNALLKKINILLVLDNMRRAISLEEIGFPTIFNSNISKIITSRSFAVCCEMQCGEIIALKSLSDDEAYELLKDEIHLSRVFRTKEIEFTLKRIAKECGGLPLAIVAAAKRLRKYFKYDHLVSTERSLKMEYAAFSNLKYIEDKIIQYLKLSYEQLERSSYSYAKECLLHYIMYPRNHAFTTMELMNNWMAAGLLGDVEGIDEQLGEAKEILEELKDASLLESIAYENGEEIVKMHPIVWDMAVKLEKQNSRFFTKLGCRIEQFSWEDLSENVERVSLRSNNLKELPSLSSAFKFRKLSTLILQGNPLHIQLGRRFFNKFPNLRILDLSDTQVRLEPESLSCLKYLTVLLLRNCTHLTNLPPRGCPIQDDSAAWIEDVQKLRYLSVLEVTFPSLQLYNSYTASLHWRQLSSFKFCVGGSYKGKLKNNSLAFIKEFLDDQNWFLDNTSKLLLMHCHNVTQLTIPTISNLKFLDVSYCTSLKHLFTDSVADKLQNLEEIVIAHCENLVKLIEKDSSRTYFRSIFWQNLRKLALFELPRLQFIYDGTMPTGSVEEIGIWKCPQLQNFPIPLLTSLKGIRGDNSWLENLKRNSDPYITFFEKILREPPPKELTSRSEMVVATSDMASSS